MAKGHSRGAAGGWRHGKTRFIKEEEGVAGYSVGPQNVALDGSNYRGAGGASYADIQRAVAAAEKSGSRRVTIATLIRRDSQKKGFRWVSTSKSIDEFRGQLSLSQLNGVKMGDFAFMVHAARGKVTHSISNALTWTIIPEG